MFRVPAWFRRRGIRGRLTLWYTIAIPIVIFALAVGARAVLVATLQESMDTGLQDRAQNLTSAILAAAPQGSDDYETIASNIALQSLPSVPLWVRISGPRGLTLGTFGEVPQPLADALDRLAAAPDEPGRFETVRVSGHDALRVYSAPVIEPSTGRLVAVVQTADSLAPLAAAQARLWWYTAAIGLTGSVITIAVGVFIVHQGYRPLDRILRRVQEMQTSGLAAGLEPESRPPELQMLADSLNSMWRRLDATFSSQQRFVAAMSHDLRTPLTALRGQIEVLGMSPDLAPSAAEALNRMSNEVNRMIRMTNNLLTASQFDSRAPVASSQVDLRELLRGVVMDMRGVARHVTLGVDAPIEVVVMGDYDLLKQALVNLVDNALKSTPVGGRVTLEVRVDQGEAVVSVTDTGSGMTPERLRELAAPADQPRLLARGRRGGAGLGLSIVRQIVSAHHGRIDITSTVHVGTSATFRIPLLLAVGDPELLDSIA